MYMATTLHFWADTGIPPLQLTKYVHLAQLHFRLTITRPDTLPALLFKKLKTPFSPSLSNLHTTTLDYTNFPLPSRPSSALRHGEVADCPQVADTEIPLLAPR